MYSYQIKEKIKSYCPLMKCVCNLFSSSYGIGKTRGSQTFGDWGILFILVVFFSPTQTILTRRALMRE